MRGRKPKPTALKIAEGNPGKRRINGAEPKPPASLPDPPPHLSVAALEEWHRIAGALNQIGLLTQADRSTMAAYCQCYARWVEAEEKLATTPAILRLPSGYIQQSPWLTISNKQLELMAKYMAEIGLTPASRSRLVATMTSFQGVFANDADGLLARPWGENITEIRRVIVRPGEVPVDAEEVEAGTAEILLPEPGSSN